jgi:hypothetical protein
VVVSRRSGHTALFYRDNMERIWFTEREGGVVWRESPLLLTPYRVFLPVVFRGASGAAATAPEELVPDRARLAASTFVSELSAISRNENHLAVFGVDDLGQLMVKEWTSRNASDWSDTQWVRLMTGVAPEKPGVASRHSNHLTVAVRDTSGVAHTIEWSDDTGWTPAISLGETFAGPLTLSATDTDEMFLLGVDELGDVRSMHWTADAGWEGPEVRASSGVQGQVIAATVRRPDDLMFLMRTENMVDKAWRGVYSALAFTQTEREFAPPQSEFYRNQVLVRVGSRSYYLAADEGATGSWKVEAWDLDGDIWQPRLELGDHPYVAGSPVSVAAGDLDFDGSDEIIVATYEHPTATLSVVDLIVTNPETDPELSMVVAATVTETFLDAQAQDLSLAIGDLDGDLRRNEVVLAAVRGNLDSCPGGTPWDAVAKLYQFVPGPPAELQEKSAGFLTLDSPLVHCDPENKNVEWELEIAAGRFGLSGYPSEQLAVAFTGERNCPACDYLDGRVHIYTVPTLGTLEPIHSDQAPASGDPLEFPGSSGNPYRSAIATGDLDADGYDEIAAWYVDRVFTIDPNDLDENLDPTVQEFTLIPDAPGTIDDYFQAPRSLALGDLDRDGRAEILAAANFVYEALPGGVNWALLELVGDDELRLTEDDYSHNAGEVGTVLVGDLDGDGLVSELVGCNTAGEYTVVAVVNGLPRWYESGVPLFDSTGSYSVEEGGGSSESSGTNYNIGAALTVGYEREINIPFVGTVASFRASVTQDFLYSQGVSQEREEIMTFGSDYSFEEGLGLVVYNLVDSACYYYDIFSPEDPLERSSAMSCKPGGSDTLVMTLEHWHQQSTKDAAGYSWVDVGHRAPSGALTNDLLEPGNYAPTLPVDEFLLLWKFPSQYIAQTGGAQESWYASQASGGARTQFTHMETNTTASAGATTGGVSVDVSATFGMGWDNSNTISWQESISFAGGYSWPAGGSYPPYWVAPYVYQSTAKTLAGATYPYWVMDYYVPGIGP